MQAIFDKAGEIVGWKNDYLLFDVAHDSAGHIQSSSVFDIRGNHVGEYVEGYFWELDGLANAFVADARNGPTLPPFTASHSHPAPPLPPLPEIPSASYPRLMAWSDKNWQEYMGLHDA